MSELAIRPIEFPQPDFYIADDGRRLRVGRIYCASAGVPADRPWFWTVEHHQRAGRARPHDGYEVDLEAAKAAWKRCWESADVPINWPPSLR